MEKYGRIINFYAFLLVFCCLLLLGGCAATVKYNTSVPPEKLCALDIDSYLTVVTFDGEKVHWAGNPWHSETIVQIPEGRHTFTVFWNTGRYASTPIRVSGDFVAGRRYKMTPEFPGGGGIQIRIDEVPAPRAGEQVGGADRLPGVCLFHATFQRQREAYL